MESPPHIFFHTYSHLRHCERRNLSIFPIYPHPYALFTPLRSLTCLIPTEKTAPWPLQDISSCLAYWTTMTQTTNKEQTELLKRSLWPSNSSTVCPPALLLEFWRLIWFHWPQLLSSVTPWDPGSAGTAAVPLMTPKLVSHGDRGSWRPPVGLDNGRFTPTAVLALETAIRNPVVRCLNDYSHMQERIPGGFYAL